jgi:hypothetical protein
MNNPSLAKSEVWKVRLMIGNLIHLFASLRLVPNNKVYRSKGIDARKMNTATLEYIV